MPFVAFPELCPEVAERETRTITVLPGTKFGLPADDYEFTEMYCNEPGCDCRRVFFMVLSSTPPHIQAVIAWGWEDLAFYRRWLGMDDPQMLRELQGPILNPGSPQSKNAEALLELTRNVLLADPAYVERLKQHYALFRSKIDSSVKKGRKQSGKRSRTRRR